MPVRPAASMPSSASGCFRMEAQEALSFFQIAATSSGASVSEYQKSSPLAASVRPTARHSAARHSRALTLAPRRLRCTLMMAKASCSSRRWWSCGTCLLRRRSRPLPAAWRPPAGRLLRPWARTGASAHAAPRAWAHQTRAPRAETPPRHAPRRRRAAPRQTAPRRRRPWLAGWRRWRGALLISNRRALWMLLK
ncbi:MAG: hypothetical protein J3K34DRAFT_422917 [Monoraphidium minutum]|nr:MAG: hypothetical protein J3K34DRAFT_422917 [Monoraphidium minutum]